MRDGRVVLPDVTRVAGGEADVSVNDAIDPSLVGPPAPENLPSAPVEAARGPEIPAMASLTPFYSQSRAVDAPAPVSPPLVAEPATAEGALRLQFSGDSWVEILGHDGGRLAYGLMRAGEVRDFDPAKVARISLGNSAAVEVRMNGAVMDIAPYRRANVARFTVSSDGSLAPAGG